VTQGTMKVVMQPAKKIRLLHNYIEKTNKSDLVLFKYI